MHDPYTHSYVAESTNTVAVAIYWNAISTLSILFVYFYDGVRGNGMGVESVMMIVFTVIIAAFSAASMAMVKSIDMVVPMCFMLLYIILSFLQIFGGKIYDKKDAAIMPSLSKKLLFWTGYILVMPGILTSYNMLTQKRDANFNWTSAISMLVLGLTALSSECFYTFSGSVELLEQNVEYKNSLMQDQSSFFTIVSGSAVLQIAGIIFTSQSSLPDYSFDSTYIGLCAALPLMIGISLFQISRLAVGNLTGDEEGSKYWLHRSMITEVLARTIFTLCVVYDLRSLSTMDSRSQW